MRLGNIQENQHILTIYQKNVFIKFFKLNDHCSL